MFGVFLGSDSHRNRSSPIQRGQLASKLSERPISAPALSAEVTGLYGDPNSTPHETASTLPQALYGHLLGALPH